MIKELKVSPELRALIQETCREYEREFRRHRKNVNHFSKNGLYYEWENYKFEEREI